MCPCQELAHILERDAAVIQFGCKFTQRMLPNGSDVHVAVEMGCGISLVFDCPAEAGNKSQDAPRHMTPVSLCIPAIACWTAKTHADAEEFGKDAAHHGLEAKNDGPRIPRSELSAGVVGRHVDGRFCRLP